MRQELWINYMYPCEGKISGTDLGRYLCNVVASVNFDLIERMAIVKY